MVRLNQRHRVNDPCTTVDPEKKRISVNHTDNYSDDIDRRICANKTQGKRRVHYSSANFPSQNTTRPSSKSRSVQQVR
jgi:hypothetical protein